MSDIQKPSNPPDEPEPQGLPVEAGQAPAKGNRKSKRNRNTARLSPNMEQDQKEQAAPQIEEQETANAAMLAEIRRSLMEEEASKQEKKKGGFFRRVTGRLNPNKAPIVEPKTEIIKPYEFQPVPVVENVQNIIEDTDDLSSGDENTSGVEADQTSRPEAELESVAIMPLEQDVAANLPSVEAGELIPEMPQAELLPLSRDKIDESFETIRDVALENYDDSPLPAEDMQVIPWRQKLRIFVRKLRPLDRALILGTVSLIIIAGMIGLGFSIVNSQVAQEPPKPTQELPFPVRVTLPGGWEFKLAKGKVENGKWTPVWAEWLEGTELCKWVALPWTLQLEAVVRSLKSDDIIELTMSNTDSLKFKVQSIQNVPADQISTLNKTTASLLLILVSKDADTRWVVTAIP